MEIIITVFAAPAFLFATVVAPGRKSFIPDATFGVITAITKSGCQKISWINFASCHSPKLKIFLMTNSPFVFMVTATDELYMK